MTNPTFSIRGLLGVTTFIAFSCVVLAKPSVYWVYPVPFFLCILTACTALRVTRNYWLSVVAGAAVYILTTAAIDAMYSRLSSAFALGWAYRLYKLLHDDRSNQTITAFLASVHLIAALTVASVSAYVAQLIWPPRGD